MVLTGRRGSFYSKYKGSGGDRQSVMVAWLGPNRFRLILNSRLTAEMRVLCPERGTVLLRNRVDHRIGKRQPLFQTHRCGLHGKVRIQINHRPSLHRGDCGKSIVFTLLLQNHLENFVDTHCENYEKISVFNRLRKKSAAGSTGKYASHPEESTTFIGGHHPANYHAIFWRFNLLVFKATKSSGRGQRLQAFRGHRLRAD